jgi:hypothetical protein
VGEKPPLSPEEIGEYCRRVEDHLTRANTGHLVRIVGPGFELVRHWALTGVPLSIVFRGIDMKAERHREGQARRPLRIEFCDPDVRAMFVSWRRAIGLPFRGADDPESGDPGLHSDADGGARGLETPGEPDEARQPEPESARRPSLTRHLDRAIDRLSRIGGRLDLPVELRDACDRVLQELAGMRTPAAKARGAAREELTRRLGPLDAELAAAVRAFAPDPLRAPLVADAMADLAPYRGRLAGDAWQHSVDVTVDRLLRDRLGLPMLEL